MRWCVYEWGNEVCGNEENVCHWVRWEVGKLCGCRPETRPCLGKSTAVSSRPPPKQAHCLLKQRSLTFLRRQKAFPEESLAGFPKGSWSSFQRSSSSPWGCWSIFSLVSCPFYLWTGWWGSTGSSWRKATTCRRGPPVERRGSLWRYSSLVFLIVLSVPDSNGRLNFIFSYHQWFPMFRMKRIPQRASINLRNILDVSEKEQLVSMETFWFQDLFYWICNQFSIDYKFISTLLFPNTGEHGDHPQAFLEGELWQKCRNGCF